MRRRITECDTKSEWGHAARPSGSRAERAAQPSSMATHIGGGHARLVVLPVLGRDVAGKPKCESFGGTSHPMLRNASRAIEMRLRDVDFISEISLDTSTRTSPTLIGKAQGVLLPSSSSSMMSRRNNRAELAVAPVFPARGRITWSRTCSYRSLGSLGSKCLVTPISIRTISGTSRTMSLSTARVALAKDSSRSAPTTTPCLARVSAIFCMVGTRSDSL